MARLTTQSQEPTRIEPTPRDKGVTLTLDLTIYDNGFVQLDGVPQQDIAGAYLALAQKVYALWLQHQTRSASSPA